jgi:signal transduction histidine kinase
MVDLELLPKADGKPAVYLQAITVGRNSQFPSHGLSLPPGTHHVDLQFDAVEISSPEKIRLQYRLDGVDTEWLDAGYPAHAIYSYVPPGAHSFHIRATNRGGIWDRTGVVFTITQAPFLYQMHSFQFAAVALVIVLLAAAYYFRVRRLAAAMNVRFDERLAERTRIARDLHDTLLQSIEGSRIVADDALKHGPDPGRMERALKRLSGWLAQASEEGRSALSSLRSSAEEGNDLGHAFQRAGDECMLQRPIEFSVLIEGTAGEMHPIVRDEVYLIGYESIRNACLHSGACRLTVELDYREGLSLRVRDNGKGMDPNLAAAGKGGHFGMLGMYERAARIKGKLTISSSPANGTQVELVVPRSIAFHRSDPVRRSLSQKLTHFLKRGDRREFL